MAPHPLGICAQDKMANRSRSFCFTLNNPTPDEERLIQALEALYVIYGREKAPKTGTPHLQGYVYFENGKTESAARKLLPRAHVERARGDAWQNMEYCSKDGDVFTKGTPPASTKEKGDGEVSRWAEAYKAVEERRYEDVPPDIICRSLRQIEYAVERVSGVKRKVSMLEGELEHEWIYGPPRTGKSRYVSEAYSDAYLKDPTSRWWDGYNDQDVVVLDDYDSAGVRPIYLKRWLDRYPFPAEVKKGQAVIRPRKVVITSNYHPNELWRDETTRKAILARVKLIKIDHDNPPPPLFEADEPGPPWSENAEWL